MPIDLVFCENKRYQTLNRWVLFGLNILSWIFNVVTLAGCNFVKAEAYIPGTFVYVEVASGLFSFENGNNECTKYDKGSEYDSGHQAGRAFGVLTNLFLIFAMVGISLIIFYPFSNQNMAKMIWLTTKILYVVAFCTNLFTFSFVSNDLCNDIADCTLGPAGVITVLNVFILLGMISVCWFVPLPDETISCGNCCNYNQNGNNNATTNNKPPDITSSPEEVSQHSQTGRPPAMEVRKTIEELPNGQRKIIEEVIHPDGSRTVTETYETINDEETGNNKYSTNQHSEDEEEDDGPFDEVNMNSSSSPPPVQKEYYQQQQQVEESDGNDSSSYEEDEDLEPASFVEQSYVEESYIEEDDEDEDVEPESFVSDSQVPESFVSDNQQVNNQHRNDIEPDSFLDSQYDDPEHSDDSISDDEGDDEPEPSRNTSRKSFGRSSNTDTTTTTTTNSNSNQQTNNNNNTATRRQYADPPGEEEFSVSVIGSQM